ncbi:penicillin-insensitive murein endopeptidase [Microbulbifer hainanensis]|uniref:penicillin-insensitive murein endopeptidase n=1 Tax=Microbulbifer hainanensis TaxID=2735675 RepID=UPI001867A4B5|nr:penicillin-insensitive murein endopeptidase [Microbulbifer hainanensis]
MFRPVLQTLLCSAALFVAANASADNPWEQVKRPSSQPSDSIGNYSNGCVAGAAEMPLRGAGFQVMRSDRDRRYGNPELIQFLEDLSTRVANRGLGRLQIGDMSLPRGGPFSHSSHKSHQTGLDVDIWYSQDARALKRPLTPWEREHVSAIPLADDDKNQLIEKNWDAMSDTVPQILRLVSEDPRVERIFVHPSIKRKLCDISGSDNNWLRKVRPWWGHSYHFHVRLACPDGDRNCKPQHPVTQAACGADLNWWFSDEFLALLHGTAPKSKKPKREPPPMPAQCNKVLSAPGARSGTDRQP